MSSPTEAEIAAAIKLERTVPEPLSREDTDALFQSIGGTPLSGDDALDELAAFVADKH